jgi:F0F1-type ATP synthase assembly protein I
MNNRNGGATPMGGDQPRRQRTEPTKATKSSAQLTEAEEERYKRARLRAIGLALEFGFTTMGALAICLGGGIWLDRRFGTAPLLTLLGLLLAFITVGYNLYQLATVRIGPSRPRKPAATQSSQPRRPANNWDDDERDEDDDWPVRRRTDG